MTLLCRTLDAWGRLNIVLLKAARWIIIALIGLMTAIIAMQVVFRYGLNDALSWSGEVARSMMVWMTFLGIPIASFKAAHASLTMIVDCVPEMARDLLIIALQLVCVVVLLYGLEYSWAYAQSGLRVSGSAVPIPKFFSYAAVPMGFALALSVTGELIAKCILATFSRHARLRFGGVRQQIQRRAEHKGL